MEKFLTLSWRSGIGIVLLIVLLLILTWNYGVFPFRRKEVEVKVTFTPVLFEPAQAQVFSEEERTKEEVERFEERFEAYLKAAGEVEEREMQKARERNKRHMEGM